MLVRVVTVREIRKPFPIPVRRNIDVFHLPISKPMHSNCHSSFFFSVFFHFFFKFHRFQTILFAHPLCNNCSMAFVSTSAVVCFFAALTRSRFFAAPCAGSVCNTCLQPLNYATETKRFTSKFAVTGHPVNLQKEFFKKRKKRKTPNLYSFLIGLCGSVG